MKVLAAMSAMALAAASPWGPVPAQRAAALVAKMNISELINQVHGQGMKSVTTGYIGSVAANARLGIPLLGLEDGPQGVADGVPGVTAFPGALTVVQTWDPLLAYEFGSAQAAEQKAKGSAVLLGPGTNLARVPQGGRNFEYAGEDPYLASIFMYFLVRGIQSQNVSATIKHFFLNNQEHNRESYSANVQQRAQMELYIKPFWAAVDAGVGSAMCSYNRVNGTYACENAEAIALLKEARNFSGFLVSHPWSVPSAIRLIRPPAALSLWSSATHNESIRSIARAPASPLTALAFLPLHSSLCRFSDDRSKAIGARRTAPSPARCLAWIWRCLTRTSLGPHSLQLWQTGLSRWRACRTWSHGSSPPSSQYTIVHAKLRLASLSGCAVAAVLFGKQWYVLPPPICFSLLSALCSPCSAVGFMDDQPTPAQNLSAPATSAENVALARTLAAESTVLLKNDGGILPLDASSGSIRSIAILGDAATYYGGGSGSVIPTTHTTPYQAIFEAFNGYAPALRPVSACTNTTNDILTTPYIAGTFACFEGLPGPAACAQRCANISGCNGYAYAPARRCNGWVWSVNTIGTCEIFSSVGNESTPWPDAVSGTCTPAPLVPDASGEVNISTYIGSDVNVAAALAAAADVVIVNVALTCSEGDDRPNLSLPDWQNALVSAATAVNNRTIAVVRAPAAALMPWLSDVAAATYHGMPGIGAAQALADVLTGAVNPSGKLPVSFPASDNATWLLTPAQYPGVDNGNGYPDVDYSEGLGIGYRFYDVPGSPAPLFPFGFGLSYTTFAYSSLTISGSITLGGGSVRVRLQVTNTGAVDGSEVIQLYVSHPAAAGEPPKILAGFSKLQLSAGETSSASFDVSLDTVQVWNTTSQGWSLVPGTYGVLVGSSSTDIRLTGSFVATA